MRAAVKARSTWLAVIASGVLLGVLLEAVTIGVRTATSNAQAPLEERARTAMTGVPAQDVARTRAATLAASPARRLVLPPVNAPLAPVLPALREAGLRGDGPAACRYAMEVTRCAQHARDVEGEQSMRQFLDREKGIPPEKREQIDRLMAGMRARIARDAPVCRDVPPEELKGAWRVLFAAARDGHVPSMARFATASQLLGSSARAEFDEEALAAYRTYGLRFLEAAARAGDIAAIEKLGRDSLEPGGGTRAVPYDPVKGIAYLKALAAHAAPAYRDELSGYVDNSVAVQGIRAEDVQAADALARTIIPAWLRDDYPKPRFEPEDGFGCGPGRSQTRNSLDNLAPYP